MTLYATGGARVSRLWNLKTLPGLIVEVRMNNFTQVEEKECSSSEVDAFQVSSGLFLLYFLFSFDFHLHPPPDKHF